MLDQKFEFTIFTPCYNSERFIDRLHKSIEDQTFKNFEWLVIEDCSTDNTKEILQNIQKNSDLNINLIFNKTNKMISYNCNLAVQKASGKFFIFLGHDDELVPNALEKFFQAWSEISSLEKNKLAGMISNCQDGSGNSVRNQNQDENYIANFFDRFYADGFKGEQCLCYLTDVMRKHNFKTFERYIPELVMLFDISDTLDTYFLKENLRIYHTDHISFSDNLTSLKYQYPLGERTLYLENLNKRSHKLVFYPKILLGNLTNFNRLSLHSNLSLFSSIADIHIPLLRCVAFLIYPVSLLLFLKDKYTS